MRVFLSYSTKDGALSGKIKDLLEFVGLDVFLAPRSITPSEEWRGTIRRNLRQSVAVVAVLTRNFHKSKWTDQEVGMAMAWGKPIITLVFSTRLYGFLSDKQAVHADGDDLTRSLPEVLSAIVKKRPNLKRPLRRRVLNRLLRSKSYDDSLKCVLAIRVVRLGKAYRRKVWAAAQKNNQIWGYQEVRDYVDELNKEFGIPTEPKEADSGA